MTACERGICSYSVQKAVTAETKPTDWANVWLVLGWRSVWVSDRTNPELGTVQLVAEVLSDTCKITRLNAHAHHIHTHKCTPNILIKKIVLTAKR